jgi:hypothetical protein
MFKPMNGPLLASILVDLIKLRASSRDLSKSAEMFDTAINHVNDEISRRDDEPPT